MINITPIKGSTKWKRNLNCDYMMSKSIRKVVSENDFEKTKKDNWDVYFPCTYNKIKKETDVIELENDNQRMFIIDNADQITSKDSIWRNIVDMYGFEKSCQIMPKTYNLRNKNDVNKFNKEYDENKVYILKKNIQRQEGLKITKNKKEIMNGLRNNSYIIVQELLQDPYLVNGRKINLRCYLLIMCKEGDVEVYVHKNGFMYYTKKKYNKNDLSHEGNVTTGYIDRKVYDENPLTLKDFRKYLDNEDRKMTHIEQKTIIHNDNPLSQIVFERVYKVLTKAFIAILPHICNNKKFDKNLSFQLFGSDIAISDTLIPHIIEVNKGPDLGFKDDRDKKVKYKLVKDVFNLAGLTDTNNNEFIQLV